MGVDNLVCQQNKYQHDTIYKTSQKTATTLEFG